MQHTEFLDKLSDEQIASAIARAEQKTTGHIRVYVSHHAVSDPVIAAQHRFDKLHMHHTLHRNAVLIFVAPKSRNFAVIGDAGIHQKCGEPFWQELTSDMAQHFKNEQWTQALLHGIEQAGELLAKYFPQTTSQNVS
ncbi:MAG TPA: TPM domain-containing protein [Tepidisphaeraceae bacterium]|jgi:uncharacterized membrane protein